MEPDVVERLTIQHTRTINSLIFQLLATRQALHAVMATVPDPDHVASVFEKQVADTLSDLSQEPDQEYLAEAYAQSADETLAALGQQPKFDV